MKGGRLACSCLRACLTTPHAPNWRRLDLLGPQFDAEAAEADFGEVAEELGGCALAGRCSCKTRPGCPPCTCGSSPSPSLLTAPAQPPAGMQPGGQESLLAAAIRFGHDVAFQLLLAAAPAAARAAEAEGKPLLQQAVELVVDEDAAYQAIELLLAALPDPAAAVSALPVELLHSAATENEADVLRLLVAAAPGVAAAQDEEGNTTTIKAAMYGWIETLRELLEAAPQTASMANVLRSTLFTPPPVKETFPASSCCWPPRLSWRWQPTTKVICLPIVRQCTAMQLPWKCCCGTRPLQPRQSLTEAGPPCMLRLSTAKLQRRSCC